MSSPGRTRGLEAAILLLCYDSGSMQVLIKDSVSSLKEKSEVRKNFSPWAAQQASLLLNFPVKFHIAIKFLITLQFKRKKSVL